MNTIYSRRRRGMISVFFLLSLLATGCRYPGITSEPKPTDRYETVMAEWTREARSYEGLDLQLLVVATYQSDPFVTAYVSEYSKIYKLPPSETERMEKAQEKAARQFYRFLVAVYVPVKRLDDFGRKDSIWRIYLTVDDTRRITPADIEKMKFADAKTARFFPYVTPWKSAYLIRFPKPLDPSGTDSGKNIRLDVTGVGGSVALTW